MGLNATFVAVEPLRSEIDGLTGDAAGIRRAVVRALPGGATHDCGSVCAA